MTLDFGRIMRNLAHILRSSGGNSGHCVTPPAGGVRTREDEQDIERVLETFRGLITRLSQDGTEIGEICVRAEQKAARYALLSETVVESVTSGILVIDDEDRVLLANSSAKRILDIGAQTNLVGMDLHTLFKDGRDFGHLVRRCMETATNASREIRAVVTPAGKGKRLGVSASCVGSKPGAVEAVIVVFTSLGDESILRAPGDQPENSIEAHGYLRGILDSYDLITRLIAGFGRIEEKSNRGTLTTSELREFSRSMRSACDTMMAFALASGVDDSIPEIVDVNEVLESVIIRLGLADESRLRRRLSENLPRVKSVRKILDVGLSLLIRGCISQSSGCVEIASGHGDGDAPYLVTIDVKDLSPSKPVARIGGSLREFMGEEDTQREAGLFLLSKLHKESHFLQVHQIDGFFHFSMAIRSPIEKESGPGRRMGGASDRG
jgi:PAS domain-containing protein